MQARPIGLVALAVALACGAPAESPRGRAKTERRAADQLETVDVGGAIDADLSTSGDEQARGVGSHVAGVLPGGFPRDLPLPKPSTLVDFGAADGRSFVVLRSSQAVGQLRPRWESQLSAAGWKRAGAEWSRNGRRVRIGVEDAAPGTRVRIEYRPG